MALFNDVIYNNVLAKIIATYEKIPPYIAAPVIDIILLGVILSITYQGLEVIRGAGGANPILDVIAKNMRPLFVLLFAASAQGYADNILPLIKEDLPQLFIAAVDKASGITTTLTNDYDRFIFISLDSNINDQLAELKKIVDIAKSYIFKVDLVEKTWFTLFGVDIKFPTPDIDVTGIPALIIAGVIFLVIVIAAIIVCLQAAFIVIAWNFVLAFGPIFLAMYAFEKTEKYALHWFESALKYTFALIVLIVLYTIFASLLTAEMVTLANNYTDANHKDVGAFMQNAISPIVIAIVSVYILTRADQLAQDLIGGGVSGSGGFAQSMGGRISGAARSAAGSVAGAAKAVGGKAVGAAGSVARKVTGTSSSAKSSPASSMLNASMRNIRAR